MIQTAEEGGMRKEEGGRKNEIVSVSAAAMSSVQLRYPPSVSV